MFHINWPTLEEIEIADEDRINETKIAEYRKQITERKSGMQNTFRVTRVIAWIPKGTRKNFQINHCADGWHVHARVWRVLGRIGIVEIIECIKEKK